MTVRDIAKMIDHALLKPEMTPGEVKAGCLLAKEYGCATVCVKPSDVPLAYSVMHDSEVKVSTVIGFPHGAHTTRTKVAEANEAMDNGCAELDMVLNIGRLIDGDLIYVESDIRAVVNAAHARGVLVKVIFENCYLTKEQKLAACRICDEVGADFVKTSTGFGTGGAKVEDLRLMRETCSDRVAVKAAGGVRTLDQLLTARTAGAVRCGTTSTQAILEEALEREANGTLAGDKETELGGGY